MSRLIQRLRSDDGVTLTELMVVLMLMGIVSVIFSTAVVSALRSTRNVEGVARSNDDIRLAIATLDRELRSASQICTPGPAESGDILTFQTRLATGTETITYRIDDPDADGVGTLVKSDDNGDRVVVEGVVNGFVAAETGVPEPMFTNQGITEAVGPSTTVTGSPSFGKVISLRVWVDSNPRDDISPKLETTELSGRNVWTPNAGCT
jgi:prepilin-type N-terminal cleavage/methylation domain-containing protein